MVLGRALSREPGRAIGAVAASLSINRGLLQRWRNELEPHGAETFPGNGRLKPSDQEVAQLRKKLVLAQQESDLL